MTTENILLITTDSLRADHVYGDCVDTPAHDQLAREGVTYERSFAQGPFTTFSMPSLFTSRYPSGLDYLEFSEKTVGVYIEAATTITEALQEAGYRTAGFHSNPLLSHLFGFDQGFETFDARLPLTNTDFVPGRAKILADKLLRLVRKHAYLPADRLTSRALDWLDEKDDGPFFLWLHYMDVHGPYKPTGRNSYLNKFRGERLWRKCLTEPDAVTPTERQKLLDWYREEIRETDAQIGRLLDGLRDRNLYDNTVTVATADHGEQFDEYGEYSHPHELYDVLTQVPLIVRHPEWEQETVSDVVELTDVAPTLTEVAGADRPETFRGSPLPPLGSDDEEATAISEADITPAYHGSVRTAEWRYIRNDLTGEERLFDTTTPATDRTDCSEANPETVDRLAETLDEHLDESARTVGQRAANRPEGIEDSEVEGRLEELGYLE
jgi:arylsulfatase